MKTIILNPGHQFIQSEGLAKLGWFRRGFIELELVHQLGLHYKGFSRPGMHQGHHDGDHDNDDDGQNDVEWAENGLGHGDDRIEQFPFDEEVLWGRHEQGCGTGQAGVPGAAQSQVSGCHKQAVVDFRVFFSQ